MLYRAWDTSRGWAGWATPRCGRAQARETCGPSWPPAGSCSHANWPCLQLAYLCSPRHSRRFRP